MLQVAGGLTQNGFGLVLFPFEGFHEIAAARKHHRSGAAFRPWWVLFQEKP